MQNAIKINTITNVIYKKTKDGALIEMSLNLLNSYNI